MKKIVSLLFAFLILCNGKAQVDARLLRYPDISQTQIAFVYGGDIWIVSKSGGTANRLTSSAGEESYPRFSPDGRTLGFTAVYNSNADIYTMPVTGGIPTRLTFHSMPDRMVEWYPDGNKILFASARSSGSLRFNQFYLIPKNGGLPEKLPLPYGELGSFSPDGNSLAYVTRITENFPFKRYRGGYASDVLMYNLKQNTVENITDNAATDGKPAWYKNRIYYVSDAGKNKRRNIWVYDISSKKKEELTGFDKEDVNYMSAGPEDLVFEAGGKLYTMNLSNHQYAEVKINVVYDMASLMPRMVQVGKQLSNGDISPDGKRVVLEARGELFNLPSENGFVQNITRNSGAFDRNPAWSPNGRYIAFWSDESGENEIYLRDMKSGASTQKITSFKKGFGWNLYWSPDSKKIAFIDDQQAIRVITVGTREVVTIDHARTLTYNSLSGFTISWSPDGQWLAYSKTQENNNEALFLYNLAKKSLYKVTSGFYNDTRPVFDPKGKYLFFFTDRNLQPQYSSLDATWIYPNSTQLAGITLDPATVSLLSARNDEVKIADTSASEKSDKKNPDSATRVIPENMETRMEVLPVPAGNFGNLGASEGKMVYLRFSTEGPPQLCYYDLEKREEKQILAGVTDYALSKDGKSILVMDAQGPGIITVAPGQKIEKRLRTGEMEMVVNPKEEWNEIFNDTWRRYRDFFYDPNMQGVDWDEERKQYGELMKYAITRWDVNNIIGELISELSAGHTYAGGGDVEQAPYKPCGYLGIDWSIENNAFRVKKIIRPAAWDNEVRSPLEASGIGVKEGDYILSVNGRPLDPSQEPYGAFEDLSGKTIVMKVNSKPGYEGARDVVVETLNPGKEMRLRNLEWIESNRKKVEELSGGQLGYMYMPNTGQDGQTELMRQFYAQVDKKGFIIDERFNAGGQLGDRFIEMLNRPTLYYIGWRNGFNQMWPGKGNDGPKVMLINGWAGSGGDAFPWAFQEMKMGPIVGERTLGILVGPATGHTLIDGGYITVPDARLYGSDGKWFAEGYGIVPDIPVWDDPSQLVKGDDPQLIRAVQEALKQVKTNPRKIQPKPAYENRTASGIKD